MFLIEYERIIHHPELAKDYPAYDESVWVVVQCADEEEFLEKVKVFSDRNIPCRAYKATELRVTFEKVVKVNWKEV